LVDDNYTHILAIVDRSGSMAGSANRMTAALNEFFQSQAELEGKCLVDYVQFDTVYEKVYEDQDVKNAEAFIVARGGTALLDAIGRGATELGSKLRRLKEVHRPGKVLVVVVTDGHENSSRSWNATSVKQLITQQEETYKWEFLFLGANIDAVAVGADYGFKYDNTIQFNIHDDEAVGATSMALTNYAGTYRGGGKGAFSAEEREKANK
jgi:hypothetical protein